MKETNCNLKNKVFVLLFLLGVELFSFGQQSKQFNFYSIKKIIEKEVKGKMLVWQKKGEFESSSEYNDRIQHHRAEQIEKYAKESMRLLKEKELRSLDMKKIILSKYDADNETFQLKIGHLPPFILKVKKNDNEAKSFKENVYYLRFNKIDLIAQNDKWAVAYIEVENPNNNKVYRYNIKEQSNYTPFEIEKLNIKDIELPYMQNNNSVLTKDKDIDVDFDNYDIEYDLPQTNTNNLHSIAILIGNAQYNQVPSVHFAINDIKSVKKYLIEVLGYQKHNIFVYQNATKTQFELCFGSSENYLSSILHRKVKPDGSSNVFIYYSGHGAPDPTSNKAYFVSSDCSPSALSLTGYSLDVFYSNLAKLKANNIFVGIDACFSGSGVLQNISPVAIKVDKSKITDERISVLTSSSANQVSTWYNKKKHGMFTYFFLKAIKDRKKSDTNKDGKLSYEEIYNYLNLSSNIPYLARRIHNVEQTPTINGNKKNILVEY